MVMMPVVMSVPVVMNQRGVVMAMGMMFGQEDHNPGEHQTCCWNEDQAGKITEEDKAYNDSKDWVDSKV